MSNLIILTTTVNVNNNILCLYQTNKEERVDTYLKSIKRWLNETSLNILVVENSGYKFNELNNELKEYNNRFQIISFNENALKNKKMSTYLMNSKSKGLHEIFAINYAYYKSKFAKKNNFIIKITGRFFIPDFETYLSGYNTNNYAALTQNNLNRCEIVGAHIRTFRIIFNIILHNKNNNYDGHVENIYKYRISRFKKVIHCKIFNIEETQRGGVKQKYNDL